MTEKTRVPFVMFLEGFQYEEILNVKVGTVKSRIFVARKKIERGVAEIIVAKHRGFQFLSGTIESAWNYYKSAASE